MYTFADMSKLVYYDTKYDLQLFRNGHFYEVRRISDSCILVSTRDSEIAKDFWNKTVNNSNEWKDITFNIRMPKWLLYVPGVSGQNL